MHISKPEQCLENINGAKNPRGRFLYRKQWCPLKEVTLFLVFPLFSYESRSQVLPPSLPPNPFAEQRIDIAADADEKETSGGWRCWLTWKKKRKLKFSYECLVGFSSTTTQERHRGRLEEGGSASPSATNCSVSLSATQKPRGERMRWRGRGKKQAGRIFGSFAVPSLYLPHRPPTVVTSVIQREDKPVREKSCMSATGAQQYLALLVLLSSDPTL